MHTGRLSHGPVGPQKDTDHLAVASNLWMDHGGFRTVCRMDLFGQIPGGSQLRHDWSSVPGVYRRGVAAASSWRFGRVRVRRDVFR